MHGTKYYLMPSLASPFGGTQPYPSSATALSFCFATSASCFWSSLCAAQWGQVHSGCADEFESALLCVRRRKEPCLTGLLQHWCSAEW